MRLKEILLFVFTLTLVLVGPLNGQIRQKLASTMAKDTPKDVILTPPAGKMRKYYMDLKVHDPAVGFIDNYHSLVKVIFSDNGEVYFPNMIRPKMLKSYMKGKLDPNQNTISFQNKLIVGWAPNKKEYYYLRVCDQNGNLKDVKDFKFNIDKASGRISCSEDLYLALYLGDETDKYYDIAGLYKYLPAEEVNNKVDSYNLTYTKSDDVETKLSAKIKGYFEDGKFYVKGLNPKYPEMWMQGLLEGDNIKFISNQLAHIAYNDDPIVMMTMQDQGDEKYTQLSDFTLKYDKKNGVMTGLNDKSHVILANVLLNEDETLQVNQTFNNLNLTFTPLHPATPDNPEFQNFSAEEKEFTFTLPSKDIQGSLLDPDFITFRLFMDGKPYTFTKAEYPKLRSDEDLLDIPFEFNDYNYINKSDYKRYIYFKEIPNEVKTLAVEVSYKIKGVENKSQRLVYDIASGTHKYVTPSAEVATDSVAVSFSASPKESATKLTLKYNYSNKSWQYKTVPASNKVPKGKNVRAYVKLQDGYELVKFTVNGEDYSGKINGFPSSRDGQYIEIAANQELNIVAVANKPAPKMITINYQLEGQDADQKGSMQAYYGIPSEDGMSYTPDMSRPFNSGAQLEEKQIYVIIAQPKNGFLIEAWKYNKNIIANPENEDENYTGDQFTGAANGENGSTEANITVSFKEDPNAVKNPIITFATKGDPATDANATIAVTTQVKNGKKWKDVKNLQSGDQVEIGTHLKIQAKFDDGYIIKNWLKNGQVVMHKAKSGAIFVSTFNPIFDDISEAGTFNYEVELNKANLTWKYELPDGLTKKEKKEFGLEAYENDAKLYGQRMKNYVNGYYIDNLNGKAIKFTAKALEGYEPVWTVNDQVENDHEMTKTITAGDHLKVVVSFQKIVEKPTATINFTTNQQDLASLAILWGDEADATTNEIPSGSQVEIGKYLTLKVTINDPTKTQLKEITINGIAQEAITQEGLKGFQLTSELVNEGVLNAVAVFEKLDGVAIIGSQFSIQSQKGQIILNSQVAQQFAIYTIDGTLIRSGKLTSSPKAISAQKGVYIVRIGQNSYKVLVK